MRNSGRKIFRTSSTLFGAAISHAADNSPGIVTFSNNFSRDKTFTRRLTREDSDRASCIRRRDINPSLTRDSADDHCRAVISM